MATPSIPKISEFHAEDVKILPDGRYFRGDPKSGGHHVEPHQAHHDLDNLRYTNVSLDSAAPSIASTDGTTDFTYTLKANDIRGPIKRVWMRVAITPSAATAGGFIPGRCLKEITWTLGQVPLDTIGQDALSLSNQLVLTEREQQVAATYNGYSATFGTVSIDAATTFLIDVTGQLRGINFNPSALDDKTAVRLGAKLAGYSSYITTQTVTGAPSTLLVEWLDEPLKDNAADINDYLAGKTFDIVSPVQLPSFDVSGTTAKQVTLNNAKGSVAAIIALLKGASTTGGASETFYAVTSLAILDASSVRVDAVHSTSATYAELLMSQITALGEHGTALFRHGAAIISHSFDLVSTVALGQVRGARQYDGFEQIRVVGSSADVTSCTPIVFFHRTLIVENGMVVALNKHLM